jgi:hypothetical protein
MPKTETKAGLRRLLLLLTLASAATAPSATRPSLGCRVLVVVCFLGVRIVLGTVEALAVLRV